MVIPRLYAAGGLRFFESGVSVYTYSLVLRFVKGRRGRSRANRRCETALDRRRALRKVAW